MTIRQVTGPSHPTVSDRRVPDRRHGGVRGDRRTLAAELPGRVSVTRREPGQSRVARPDPVTRQPDQPQCY